MNDDEKRILLSQLRNELTESKIYSLLSVVEKDGKNRKILEGISRDEMSHAEIIKSIVRENAGISMFRVKTAVLLARIFGIVFILKLMERGENSAGRTYRKILESYPQLEKIAEDEDRHEAELIDMLNDERLNNMGAVVLGLNDALVELTGALAGFTFAIGEPWKIAKLGLITGFAAAMSMAASAFLSARADTGDGDGKNAFKSALYTGIAYIITVVLLAIPYIVLSDATVALVVMLLIALGIIAFFNYYLSVARNTSFLKGFSVMAGISTAVALISYAFGYLLR